MRMYIGLGANLGQPAAQVSAAIDAIAALPQVRLVARSGLYRSAPMGGADQPDYCNAVVMVEAERTAAQMLEALLQIERAAGRLRDGQRWGSRQLDLDLLHVDGVHSEQPQLRLPHPGIARRNFVLIPLAEIAPTLEIPGLGVIAAAAVAVGWDGLEPWPLP